MKKYKEVGFDPATLGGLAVYLTTEKGLFFVFSITGDLSEVEFDYSVTGKEDDFTKGYEIDIDYGDGFYSKLKLHIQEVLKEFQLDEYSLKLFKKWYN